MIGAGKDPTITQNDTVDTMTTFYCPTGTGEAECKSFLTDAMAKTAGNIPDDAKADQYATSVYFTACSDIYNKCLDGSTKPKAQTCFNNSIRTGSVENDGKAPYGVVYGIEYITFQDYLNRMAEGYGAECPATGCIGAGSSYAPLKKPMVHDYVKNYTADLTKNGLGLLAGEVRRLYAEAVAASGAESDEELGKIADSIVASETPFTSTIIDYKTAAETGTDEAAKKEALEKKELAEKSATATFVRSVVVGANKDDGEVNIAEVPDVLWNDKKTLNEKALVRRIFARALDLYRGKPKASDQITADQEAALAALGEAVKKAIKDKELGSVVVTDVKVDDAGKVTEVVIGDAAKAKPSETGVTASASTVPPRLLESLGILPGDQRAQAAVASFWKQIADNKTYKDNVGGDEKKADAFRDKVVADLEGELSSLDPFQIALTNVKDISKDGDVELDKAPVQLIGDDNATTLRGIEVDHALATLQNLRKLYDAALADEDSKGKDRGAIAKGIAEEARAVIMANPAGPDAGARDFYSLEWTGFDKDGKPTVGVKKAGEISGKLEMKGLNNLDGQSVVITGEIKGKHPVGDDGLAVVWQTGAKGGKEVDKFGLHRQESVKNDDLLLQATPKTKKYMIVAALNAGVSSTNEADEEETRTNWKVLGGFTYDEDNLEEGYAGVKATAELLLKKFAEINGTIGAGKIAIVDIGGESFEFGPGYVDFKVAGKTELWSPDATFEGSIWYMHAFEKTHPDVVTLSGELTQKLPAGFDLSLAAFFGKNLGDEIPKSSEFNAVQLKPGAGYEIERAIGSYNFRVEAFYEMLRILDVNRHGIGGELSLKSEDTGFSAGTGFTYFQQNAQNAVCTDKGDGFSNDQCIVTDPGSDGYVWIFTLTKTF